MQPTLAPAPPMQSSHQHHQDMNADNDLRAQLAAVINPHPHQAAHGYNDVAPSSASPHDRHIIDPQIEAHADMMSGSAESGGDDSMNDGRKGGKRELSQSKRAAQNRAAQRAFRQRKEGYIKKLEEQVRELHALEDNYKAIQTENYSLREYIIHLQSRLIESHGEYPQPPANVNLNHPREGIDPVAQSLQHRSHAHAEPAAPMGISHMSALQASAAQAVADLNTSKRHTEDSYIGGTKRFKDPDPHDPGEELSRQLQASADGLPSAL